ncbi:MAG: UDP-N-acetylglucosamine 1-carboxyvinyltransferase [Clostridia bacterium]|nr:UDP-N-acetylglucosamine 1-carboxyvinyltransferase [Clostridia bacterium]
MERLVVRGGRPLCGEYAVPPAKNAVLPMMALSVALGGELRLLRCPRIRDVEEMAALLGTLGVKVRREGEDIRLDAGKISSFDCRHPAAGQMRSSVFLLGPLLARCKHVVLAQPGGCVIGSRPIDIHLAGLGALGVRFEWQDGVLIGNAEGARAGRYRLPYPSVGATVNLLIFASSLGEVSVFENVAVEPEILDLVALLRRCGAKIEVFGREMRVRGGVLQGAVWQAVADRIVAATLVTAVATCGGEVRLHGIGRPLLAPLWDKIENNSCHLTAWCDTIRVLSSGRGQAFSVCTAPYPGFATDMQALALAHNACAVGRAIVAERVFEGRFALARELRRMGACIRVEGRVAYVEGRRLHGARVRVPDLRAGAGLVLAALAAGGTTIIEQLAPIDRGYERIEDCFAGLGADILREREIE